MPKQNRNKTKYPGVYYILGKSITTGKQERIYYIYYRKNGKQIEEKVGRQFQDDMTPARASILRASRISNEQLSNKEKRRASETEKIKQKNLWTFNKLWEEYKSRKPFNKTLIVDDNRFKNYINSLFGEKEPKKLSQFEIDSLRIKLLKTRKPQTVKHVLSLIRRISNFGNKKGLCEGISFVIEMPTVNNKKTEDLSPDQLNRLLEAIKYEPDIQIANIMRMALYTGMRRGEIFNLKWEDIDFERGFIKIKDPKGGTDQTIPLNNEARKVLKNHPETPAPFVFPNKFGHKRTDIKRQANRIKERAKLPKDFRPLHGLRHLFATMLASSGEVDMYTLQKLLTHKSPLMTQRYAHLRDETLKRASNLMGKLINKAVKENRKS